MGCTGTAPRAGSARAAHFQGPAPIGPGQEGKFQNWAALSPVFGGVQLSQKQAGARGGGAGAPSLLPRARAPGAPAALCFHFSIGPRGVLVGRFTAPSPCRSSPRTNGRGGPALADNGSARRHPWATAGGTSGGRPEGCDARTGMVGGRRNEEGAQHHRTQGKHHPRATRCPNCSNETSKRTRATQFRGRGT